jgi:hypothetical protein
MDERERRAAGRLLTAAAGLVLVSAIGLRAQAPQPPAGAAAPLTLATGPGMQEFQTTCVMCHAPDRIVGARRTRIEWEEIMDKMVSKGAQITDANWTVIEDYLLRNYGKANVNRAPKDDLVLVLGLTPADADRLLAYRKEHGPLADFDALLAVPGIDAKALEAHRAAAAF